MDHLQTINNLPYYLIISSGLLMGLVGSGHCLGMCGGLVVNFTKTKGDQAKYHIGRLLGYSALGVLIPFIGFNIVDLKNNQMVSLFAAVFLGITFIYMGLKNFSFMKKLFKTPQFMMKLNSVIWKQIFKIKSDNPIKSFIAGLLTALLPCGLLWTAIFLGITAVNPIYSLLFIGSFWFGTLPTLLTSSFIIKKFLSPFKQKFPIAVPTMFILIGLITIGFRVNSFILNTGAPTCH